MDSSTLTMPRAVFEATLMKPDPSSVPKDEVIAFYAALDKVLVECTPANVQACRAWIQSHIIKSAMRIQALGKFLMAVANRCETVEPPKPGADDAPVKSAFVKQSEVEFAKGPGMKRKRLHILYMVDDLLKHAHDMRASVSKGLDAAIPQLVTLAASFSYDAYPKHHARVNALFDVWSNNILPAEAIMKLRHVYAEAATAATPAEHRSAIPKVEAPWLIPAKHGFDDQAWYDQPASAVLNVMTPGVKHPIHVRDVVPVASKGGAAEEDTIKAVKQLLKDVEDDHAGTEMDYEKVDSFDEMGHALFKDPVTGEIKNRGGYYGWDGEFMNWAKPVRKNEAPIDGEDAPAWLKSHQPPERRAPAPQSMPNPIRRGSAPDSSREISPNRGGFSNGRGNFNGRGSFRGNRGGFNHHSIRGGPSNGPVHMPRVDVAPPPPPPPPPQQMFQANPYQYGLGNAPPAPPNWVGAWPPAPPPPPPQSGAPNGPRFGGPPRGPRGRGHW